MDMKKFILLTVLLTLLASCGSKDRGELVGVQGKKWHPEKPFGMELVPGGAFIMGKADDDLAGVHDAPAKTVTVRSFYMDETEITNSEYRQFVNWVRDSILRTKLAILADEIGKIPDDGGIGEFAFKDADTANMSVYEKYMFENYTGLGPTGYEGRKLNKDVDLIFDTDDYPDEWYTEVMDTMYLPIEESYNGQRTWDVKKFKFQYTYMDVQKAAKNRNLKRKDVIIKEEIEIYPDTTTWIRDFAYSYNEPMHNDYFWHDAYSDYPVVGVTWDQAKAFCQWRTLYKNAYQKSRKGAAFVNSFRLPSEAEWEYAARGGLQAATYPCGNDVNAVAWYSGNSSKMTHRIGTKKPNSLGLHDMSGNVWEWCSDWYYGTYYSVSTRNNPEGAPSGSDRVGRGGSWGDGSSYVRVSYRDWNGPDKRDSFLGFRLAVPGK